MDIYRCRENMTPLEKFEKKWQQDKINLEKKQDIIATQDSKEKDHSNRFHSSHINTPYRELKRKKIKIR